MLRPGEFSRSTCDGRARQPERHLLSPCPSAAIRDANRGARASEVSASLCAEDRPRFSDGRLCAAIPIWAVSSAVVKAATCSTSLTRDLPGLRLRSDGSGGLPRMLSTVIRGASRALRLEGRLSWRVPRAASGALATEVA
jgi:hypothetical protein